MRSCLCSASAGLFMGLSLWSPTSGTRSSSSPPVLRSFRRLWTRRHSALCSGRSRPSWVGMSWPGSAPLGALSGGSCWTRPLATTASSVPTSCLLWRGGRSVRLLPMLFGRALGCRRPATTWMPGVLSVALIWTRCITGCGGVRRPSTSGMPAAAPSSSYGPGWLVPARPGSTSRLVPPLRLAGGGPTPSFRLGGCRHQRGRRRAPVGLAFSAWPGLRRRHVHHARRS